MINVESKGQPHFYLLFPNIFGYMGGIQVYSALLLRTLQELYPDAHYDVFLKYDRSAAVNMQEIEFLPQTRFHFFGQHHGDRNLWRRYAQAGLAATQIVGSALRQRPTLILSTHIDYYSVAFDWCKRGTGIPYWVILHGLEAWNIQSASLKAALRHADRVVSVSTYTRDRLIDQNLLDPALTAILPNTFDADRFAIAPKPDYLLKRYGLNPDQPVILTVARLDRNTDYKGYNQILHTLSTIRAAIPGVHYVIAGKGDGRPQIEALIERLGLQNCVTLAGFIPQSELCGHYNLCDVFAMPSKGEGFGIVYLEALACGKPVLAGNQDGSVDPLAQGELGCLVDPDDQASIAQSLIQILQGSYPNPLLYQPEVLRQRTIATFGFDRFRTTLSNLLRSVTTAYECELIKIQN